LSGAFAPLRASPTVSNTSLYLHKTIVSEIIMFFLAPAIFQYLSLLLVTINIFFISPQKKAELYLPQ
jgi:hypothetical protein